MICQGPDCTEEFEQPAVGPPKKYCSQRCKATARRRRLGVSKKTVVTDRKAHNREWHRKRRRALGIPERKTRMSDEELAERRKVWQETRNAKRRSEYVKRPRRVAAVKQSNRTHAVRTEQPRPIPTELSQAWGRAGNYSQMKLKYPTRESLIAAYRRGEVPDPASSRLEA